MQRFTAVSRGSIFRYTIVAIDGRGGLAFSTKKDAVPSPAAPKVKNTGVKKKAAPVSNRAAENQDKKKEVEMLKQFVEIAEKSKKFKPEFTPEEKEHHKEIARRYIKEARNRDNKTNKDIADKIWMQQEAMRSLTGPLLEAASVIDDTPPPPDRPWAIWQTPPIKNFDMNAYKDFEKKDGDDDDDDDDNEVEEEVEDVNLLEGKDLAK